MHTIKQLRELIRISSWQSLLFEKSPMMYSPASRLQSSISIRLFTLFFLFLNVGISPSFPSLVHAQPALSPGEQKTMVMSKIKAMEQISGGPLKVTISRKSGLATFLATKPGKKFPYLVWPLETRKNAPGVF